MTMWDTLIITPFINFLLWIYSVVGNLGVAIILFTTASRILLYPLSAKQIKSSQAMQELQKNPKYLEIQKKYKDDKEKLAQEQMKLYKELNVSPFASCLPTLIQFPVIIGLYQAMIQTVASSPIDLLNLIRHIYPSFVKASHLLPLNTNFLWMNLGQPERLWLPGVTFGIPVLAVVVVITTYISTKIITPPPQPGSGQDQSAMMSNMMNVYMPLLMGWMAWTLASGLALYFVVTNLIQIFQYAITGKVYWANLIPGKKKVEDKNSLQKKNRG
jgi:YidC/Oxa1 family membrane protein insertase